MDIHKPKAAHSWREFAIEIGTIICGILIALGLEQVLQSFEWSHRVHVAEEGMHGELTDDARYAWQRIATVDCATAYFSKLRAALVASRETGAPLPPLEQYKWVARGWFTDTWENARSLQLTGHIPIERMRLYSRAFFMAANFRDQQLREQGLTPAISTVAHNGGAISPAERDRLFLALEELETQSNRTDQVALRFLENAAHLGVGVSPQSREFELSSTRKFLGACVKDPGKWYDSRQYRTDWLVNSRDNPLGGSGPMAPKPDQSGPG